MLSLALHQIILRFIRSLNTLEPSGEHSSIFGTRSNNFDI